MKHYTKFLIKSRRTHFLAQTSFFNQHIPACQRVHQLCAPAVEFNDDGEMVACRSLPKTTTTLKSDYTRVGDIYPRARFPLSAVVSPSSQRFVNFLWAKIWFSGLSACCCPNDLLPESLIYVLLSLQLSSLTYVSSISLARKWVWTLLSLKNIVWASEACSDTTRIA